MSTPEAAERAQVFATDWGEFSTIPAPESPGLITLPVLGELLPTERSRR